MYGHFDCDDSGHIYSLEVQKRNKDGMKEGEIELWIEPGYQGIYEDFLPEKFIQIDSEQVILDKISHFNVAFLI